MELLEKKAGEKRVIGVVCLTHTNRREIGMKEISETMGPCESDCPIGILDLLSPTVDSYALAWRQRCRERAEERKSKPSLAKLPIGSVIEFERGVETVRLIKEAPAYQFKTAWWLIESSNKYFQKKLIPQSYRVVYIPKAA